MNKRYRKFYVDWWNIRRSTIYGAIAIIVLLGGLAYGGWWLWRNSDRLFSNTPINETPKDAAQIVSFEGDVRVIRAATRETLLVTRPTYVSAGDTIQTQADGRAQVKMIDGSMLSIRPNSTVVIRDSASIFGGTDVRVSLDDGQINVKTEEQPENSQNVVEVLDSENRLKSQTDASFKISPEGAGGEIRISRGSVESSVGGTKTVLQGDEFATVNNGKISAKEKLINPPKLAAPSSSEQIPASNRGNADVSFRWENTDSVPISRYHLQVSTSPFFVVDALVVERDSLPGQGFTYGNIAPGVYYWRVRARANSGQTSDWSEPSRFTVVKRVGSQTLEISDWQFENVGGNIFLITGKTQPGAMVRSAGRETFASADGTFRLQISSPSREAGIEISDEKGNRGGFVLSLRTGRVSRRY
ncbi:MAG TPA: FecR domain-containing protein [Pyrinomonadaceae bacterium]|nr:FecR domain-containing protein [Pyrinomonadaceae bacterium]